MGALPLVALLHRSFRHAQLVDASRIDAKTGLLNAGTWLREARLETARAARTRTPLAVAIADIDHFKNVNDTFGHLAGDAVLAALASALNALLREADLTGRFGGEEFCILLPGTDAAEARQITERLREKISRIATPVPAGGSSSRGHDLHRRGRARILPPRPRRAAGRRRPRSLPGQGVRPEPGVRAGRQPRLSPRTTQPAPASAGDVPGGGVSW